MNNATNGSVSVKKARAIVVAFLTGIIPNKEKSMKISASAAVVSISSSSMQSGEGARIVIVGNEMQILREYSIISGTITMVQTDPLEYTLENVRGDGEWESLHHNWDSAPDNVKVSMTKCIVNSEYAGKTLMSLYEEVRFENRDEHGSVVRLDEASELGPECPLSIKLKRDLREIAPLNVSSRRARAAMW